MRISSRVGTHVLIWSSASVSRHRETMSAVHFRRVPISMLVMAVLARQVTAGQDFFWVNTANSASNHGCSGYQETVSIETSGDIEVVHMGIGSWSSSTTQKISLQVAARSRYQEYPGLHCPANNIVGYLNPATATSNMCPMTLPSTFRVEAGDALVVRLFGPCNYHKHTFSNGRVRMTLQGTFDDVIPPIFNGKPTVQLDDNTAIVGPKPNEDAVVSCIALSLGANAPSASVVFADGVGPVSVDANVAGRVDITGLQYDQFYDIYCAARDSDDNVMEDDVVADNKVTVQTISAPPVLGGPSDQTSTYVEGSPPVVLAPAITVSDADSVQLVSAVVVIVSPQSADTLTLVDFCACAGVEVYSNSGGRLEFRGTDSLDAYQSALRSVGFLNTNDATPPVGTRAIRITAADVESESNVYEATVTVVATNDPPVISVINSEVAWSETAQPSAPAQMIEVAGDLDVADEDSPDLASVDVSIASGGQTGDELDFADGVPSSLVAVQAQDGRSLSLAAPTGTGRPVSEFRAAMRLVMFRHTTRDPSSSPRRISFSATDSGSATSVAADVFVDIVPSNDPPRLMLRENTAYLEASGWHYLDPGLTLTDADSSELSGALISISSGLVSSEDWLDVAIDASGPIRLARNSSGIVDLQGRATHAQYREALRSVSYKNAADSVTKTDRTITFDVIDVVGGLRSSSELTLEVVGRGQPVVSARGGLSVEEGDPSTLLVPSITVIDSDGDQLVRASLTCAEWLASEDELFVSSGELDVDTTEQASGIVTITNPATIDAYEEVLRTLAYTNTNQDDPDPRIRTCSISVSDGVKVSDPRFISITVLPINDPPTLVPAAGTEFADVQFIEGGATQPIAAALVIQDVDSPLASRAEVKVSHGFAASEDELLVAASTEGTGVDVSIYRDTVVVTAPDGAALTTFQAILRSVQFNNNNTALPSPGDRTVSIHVSDSGGAVSETVDVRVSVVNVDDAPFISLSPMREAAEGDPTDQALRYVEGSTGLPIDADGFVSDPDDTALEGITLEFSRVDGEYNVDEDVLLLSHAAATAADFAGISRTWDAAEGRLRLTGVASIEAYTATFRGVVYVNQQDNPSVGRRTVRVVADGLHGAISIARQVPLVVIAVNDAPVVSLVPAQPLSYEEGGVGIFPLSSVVVSDVDSLTVSNATVWISDHGHEEQDVLDVNVPDGLGVSVIVSSAPDVSLMLMADPPVVIATMQALLRSVVFSNSEEFAPDTSPRTVSVTVTDSGGLPATPSTTTVGVVAVNDAPEFTLPAELITMFAGRTVSLDPADLGQPVSISDADAGTHNLTVSVVPSARKGTMTINASHPHAHRVMSTPWSPTATKAESGVYFESDGSIPAGFRLIGTQEDLNLAFPALQFTAALDMATIASLSFVADDGGASGIGGNLNATAALSVQIVRLLSVSGVHPTSGPAGGGTVLTVLGTFGDLESVIIFVGGSPCVGIVIVGSSERRCTVLAGAGLVHLRIESEAGSVILANAFEYMDQPLLESVQPSSGSAGGATRISVFGSHFGLMSVNVPAVWVHGVPCTEVTWHSSTSLSCTTGAMTSLPAGPVTVGVETGGGFIESAGRFTVQAVPPSAPAPPTFDLSASTGGSLLVRWQHVEKHGGAPVTNYSLTVDREGLGGVSALDSGGIPLRPVVQMQLAGSAYPLSAVVTGLFARTSYVFSLFASSTAGRGPPVVIRYTSLEPTVPATPPPPVLVSATGGTLVVRLEPPLDTGGIPITQYELWGRAAPALKNSSVSDAEAQIAPLAVKLFGSAVETRLRFLAANTVYELYSVVFNELSACLSGATQAAKSRAAHISTGHPTPPTSPLGLRQSDGARSGGALSVEWDEPEDLGGASAATLTFSIWMSPAGCCNVDFDSATIAGGVAPPSAGDRWSIAYEGVSRNAIVSALSSATCYCLVGASANSFGVSVLSEPIALRTELPTPPGNCGPINVLDSSGGSIRFQWQRPLDDGGADVTGYEFAIKHAETSAWPTTYIAVSGGEGPNPELSLGSHVSSVTSGGHSPVEFLLANSVYEVRVRARNLAGAASWPQQGSLVSTTAPSVPSSPTVITATLATGGAVTLMWNGPFDTGGEEIHRYGVSIGGRQEILTSGDAVAGGLLRVTGLSVASEYRVRVRAFGGSDFLGLTSVENVVAASLVGEFSSWVGFSTLSVPTSPTAPMSLGVVTVTGGAVTVSWAPPHDDGGLPIRTFTATMNGVESHTLAVSGDVGFDTQWEYTFAGLSSEASYTVAVFASSEALAGETARLTVSTIATTPPSAPRGVGVTALSDDRLRVSWQRPSDVGGSPIELYRVTYRGPESKENQTDVDRSFIHPAAGGQRADIVGVAANSTYAIWVEASNVAGLGEPSNAVHAIAEAPFGIPRRPVVLTVSGTWARVVWANPSPMSGVRFAGFVVEGAHRTSATLPADSEFYLLADIETEVDVEDQEFVHDFRISGLPVLADMFLRVRSRFTMLSGDSAGIFVNSPASEAVALHTTESVYHEVHIHPSGDIRASGYVAGEERRWDIIPHPVGLFESIRLDFSDFDLECDHDQLEIVQITPEGVLDTSSARRVLWRGGCHRRWPFSITLSADEPSASIPDEATAAKNMSIAILLTADASVQGNGFSVHYSTVLAPTRGGNKQHENSAVLAATVSGLACPSPPGVTACGGGSCNSDGHCTCLEGFGGEDCSAIMFCPDHSSCMQLQRLLLVAPPPLGNDTHGTGFPAVPSGRGLQPKPFASLTAAIAASDDGSVIAMYPGRYGRQSCGATVTAVHRLTVVGLMGAEATSIDCAGSSRAITFVDVEHGSLSQLTLTGGLADTGGALLIISSNVWLIDATIARNHARLSGGGAGLSGTASQLTLVRTLISNNTCEGRGGGVGVQEGGTVIFGQASALHGNIAVRGGGVGVRGASTLRSEASVGFPSIYGNVASDSGGNLYVESDIGEPSLVSASNLHISGGYAARGGCISVHGRLSSFMGLAVLIENCTALNEGGGLYVNEGSSISMANSSVANCSARNGGGLWVSSGASVVSNATNVFGCTARNFGGGVYAARGDAAERLTRLVGIQATSCSALRGGGVAVSPAANVQLNGIAISRCHSHHGGGLWIGEAAAVYVLSMNTIALCTASQGGGVWVDPRARIAADLRAIDDQKSAAPLLRSVVKLAVSNCSASVGGGASVHNGSFVMLTEITSCRAGQGGGMHVDGIASAVGLLIANNAAVGGPTSSMNPLGIPSAGGGGGILVDESSSLLLLDAELVSNVAEVGGGVLVRQHATLLGAAVGASLSLDNVVGHLGVFALSVNESLAAGSGLLQAPASTSYGATLVVNNHANHGGGIACSDCSVLGGIIVKSNTAGIGGGVLVATRGWSRAPLLWSVDVLGNAACAGGGFAALGSSDARGTPLSQVVAVQLSISLNRAVGASFGSACPAPPLWSSADATYGAGSGGGALVVAVQLRHWRTAIQNNKASMKGGGVAMRNSAIESTIGRITSGELPDSGSTVERADLLPELCNDVKHALKGTAYVTPIRCTTTPDGNAASSYVLRITGNSAGADGSGGNVHIAGSATSVVEASCVLNGTAADGGGIYVEAPMVSLADVVVADSNAFRHGGALFAAQSALNISDVSVGNCSAAGFGGGFFLVESTVRHSDVRIAFSRAVGGGGGVSALDSSLIGDGSCIANCTQSATQINTDTIPVAAPGSVSRDATLVMNDAAAIGGGAVHARGRLDFSGWTLAGNVAAGSGGGFLAVRGADALLTHSVFTGCVSTAPDIDGGGGGIAVAAGASVWVNLTKIRACMATAGKGGAASVLGTVLFENSWLGANRALLGGGSVSVSTGRSHLAGAAAAVEGSRAATATGCRVGVRAAVMLRSHALNVAEVAGHAPELSLPWECDVDVGSAVIVATTIERSATTGEGADGGGIHLLDAWPVAILNSTFKNNQASIVGRGGHVYQENGRLVVSRSEFLGNKPPSEANSECGASGTAAPRDVDLQTSFLADAGGGIFVAGAGTSISSGPSSPVQNASAATATSPLVSAAITVEDTSFRALYASTGAAIASEGALVVDLKRVNITECTASELGGGLFCSASEVRMRDSSCQSAAAGYDGGCLFASRSSVTIQRSTIRHCTAVVGGGVYAGSLSDISLSDNSHVTGCAAEEAGGGIFASRDSVVLTRDSTLSDNRATQVGGGIAASNSRDVILSVSNFIANSAAQGGALSLQRGAAANVGNTNFTDNVARRSGGAISLSGSSRLLARKTQFVRNTAAFGGALELDATVSDGSDGTLCDVSTVATLGDGTAFVLNTASQRGGAFYLSGAAQFSVASSTFVENVARNDGGAGFVGLQSRIEASRSDFKLNSALDPQSGRGGALFLESTEHVTLAMCTFDANAAFVGSAVYWVPEVAGDDVTASSVDDRGGDAPAEATLSALSVETLECQNCAFDGSTSASGSLSTQPIGVRLESTPRLPVQSGVPLSAADAPLLVAIVDAYGNPALLDTTAACTLTKAAQGDDVVIANAVGPAPSAGIVDFGEVALTGTPGVTYDFAISCILNPDGLGSGDVDTRVSLSVAVSLTVGRCKPAFAVSEDRTCVVCREGTWSAVGATCLPCPAGATCSQGVSRLASSVEDLASPSDAGPSSASRRLQGSDPRNLTAQEASDGSQIEARVGVTVPETLQGYFIAAAQGRVMENDCPSVFEARSHCPDGRRAATAAGAAEECPVMEGVAAEVLYACLEQYQFYPCLIPEACLPGVNQYDVELGITAGCAPGYRGPKCASCQVGYSREADGSCGECGDGDSSTSVKVRYGLLIVLVVLALTVLLFAYLLGPRVVARSVSRCVRRCRKRSAAACPRCCSGRSRLRRQSGLGHPAFKSRAQRAPSCGRRFRKKFTFVVGAAFLIKPEKFKAMLTFAQIMSSLRKSYSMRWPTAAVEFADSFSLTNLDAFSMASIDCVVPTRFFASFAFAFCFPIALMALLSCYYHSVRRYRIHEIQALDKSLADQRMNALSRAGRAHVNSDGLKNAGLGAMIQTRKRDKTMQNPAPRHKTGLSFYAQQHSPELPPPLPRGEGELEAKTAAPAVIRRGKRAALARSRPTAAKSDVPRQRVARTRRRAAPLTNSAEAAALQMRQASIRNLLGGDGSSSSSDSDADGPKLSDRTTEQGGRVGDSAMSWEQVNRRARRRRRQSTAVDSVNVCNGPTARSAFDEAPSDTPAWQELSRLPVYSQVVAGRLCYCIPRDPYTADPAPGSLCDKGALQWQLLDFRVRTLQVLLVIILISYAPLSAKVLRVLNCMQVGDNYYLVEDPLIQCFTANWWPWAVWAIFAAILYIAGIPALFFALVNREKVRNVSAYLDYIMGDNRSGPGNEGLAGQATGRKNGLLVGRSQRVQTASGGDSAASFQGLTTKASTTVSSPVRVRSHSNFSSASDESRLSTCCGSTKCSSRGPASRMREWSQDVLDFFLRRDEAPVTGLSYSTRQRAAELSKMTEHAARDAIDRGETVPDVGTSREVKRAFLQRYLYKKNLGAVWTQKQLGFLFSSFRNQFWAFELFVCTIKLFMIAVIPMLPTSQVQIIVGVLASAFFLSCYLFLSPYRDASDNRVAVLLFAQLWLNLFMGLLVFIERTIADSAALSWIDRIGLMIVFTNVCTLLFCCVLVVREVRSAVRNAKAGAKGDRNSRAPGTLDTSKRNRRGSSVVRAIEMTLASRSVKSPEAVALARLAAARSRGPDVTVDGVDLAACTTDAQREWHFNPIFADDSQRRGATHGAHTPVPPGTSPPGSDSEEDARPRPPTTTAAADKGT